MKVTILVIGRNAPILETVLRLINSQENWLGIGALTDDEALQLFSTAPVDVVLIGGGVDDPAEQKFKIAFKKIKPDVKIVRHYGGGSGLLFNEIINALEKPEGKG